MRYYGLNNILSNNGILNCISTNRRAHAVIFVNKLGLNIYLVKPSTYYSKSPCKILKGQVLLPIQLISISLKCPDMTIMRS